MVNLALAPRRQPQVRILLVEDNPSDAFLVSRMLEDNGAGYRVHHVRTQSDALAALAGQDFDVCLLDLTLPDATGLSALIDIQEKGAGMPVLILTGLRDTLMAKRAVGRGAQDYLLKDELKPAALTRAIDYAMERQRVGTMLFQRANYDALTGLANRDMFLSRLDLALARAGRSGSGVAVIFIDLDGFKPVNDLHGHDAGDIVLKTVAQRIKDMLRNYDTPSRFGGDEFAVLLEGIATPYNAANIAQKIIKALKAPIMYNGKPLEIGASIGIAFSAEPATPEILLQHADVAMYHAKKEGGGIHRFYTADMHNEAATRLQMEDDLRTALIAEELRLYYQPCIAPNGNTVFGVEALLRWKHPERGLLSAHEFLSVAEEMRLMPRIGRWMCMQLKHDIAMWNAEEVPPMHIAINLSMSQLDAPDVMEWFAPIAQENFLNGHKLAVEIPEEAVAELTKPRLITLAQLGERGIALHLDHFGRGALSLAALHSLPFSLLKFDMSLLKEAGDAADSGALVRTAILLAHQMGMKAGAVGVEAPWQVQTLKAQSCDMMQGFLTTQPMTAERLVKWLQKKE